MIGIDVDTSDDVILSQLSSVNVDWLTQRGYPHWIQHEGHLVGLLPWHKRTLKQQVYGFSRQRAHKHVLAPLRPESPVYGIDLF